MSEKRTHGKSETEVLKELRRANVDFVASLTTGIVQSVTFNPWDRALYLAVKDRRPFLSKANFTNPYQGFGQAAVHRIVSGGLYFFLQAQTDEVLLDQVLGLTPEQRRGRRAALVVGCVAGSLNGLLINQLASVKYHTWHSEGASFWKTAKQMWAEGGLHSFVKGSVATSNRDMVFGILYELIRVELQHIFLNWKHRSSSPSSSSSSSSSSSLFFDQRSDQQFATVTAAQGMSSMEKFVCNATGGAIATLGSSPFNYVRNIKFATPDSQTTASSMQIWKDLMKESKEEGIKQRDLFLSSSSSSSRSGGLQSWALYHRLVFLEQRLVIGWGTARVAFGMGIGQLVFEYVRSLFRTIS